MAADDFFARWSKKNAERAAGLPDSPVVTTVSTDTPVATHVDADEQLDRPLPTHADVEQLTHDSDFSAFMAHGVDEDVKRSAMKKLFSNPHFNVMDGLDTYIDDYNTFEALTPDILHALNHAKALLDPASQFESGLMQLLKPEKGPEKIQEVDRSDAAPSEEMPDNQPSIQDATEIITEDAHLNKDQLAATVRLDDASDTEHR